MNINFQYKSNKGSKLVNTNIEPFFILDNFETSEKIDSVGKLFGFNKKTYLSLLEHFIAIRFSNHTPYSYTLFSTINKIDTQLFNPICDEPKQRVKYLCKMSDLGIELMGIFENLFLIADETEEITKQFLLDYLELKRI